MVVCVSVVVWRGRGEGTLIFSSYVGMCVCVCSCVRVCVGVCSPRGGGGAYYHLSGIRRLRPNIYRSTQKNIRLDCTLPSTADFTLTLRKDPKMHRNVQFCDDSKKYPQNLHTPKIFIFLKTQKNIEIQNFEQKKNDPSLRMCPPPPPWVCSAFHTGF